MRKFFKLGVPAATFVVAATFGAMNAGPAHAGEFCRTDVTGHMTSCGFDTMEQCHDAASGVGGDCFRDPKLSNNGASNASGLGNVNRNALAYQPTTSRRPHHQRHGHAASPQ